ncbi:MAG: hypothetical protein VXY46_07635, partial [Pseudomonadota bacterium]|nr:hypothetical protein [Pseudomonadota bacterium]
LPAMIRLLVIALDYPTMPHSHNQVSLISGLAVEKHRARQSAFQIFHHCGLDTGPNRAKLLLNSQDTHAHAQ